MARKKQEPEVVEVLGREPSAPPPGPGIVLARQLLPPRLSIIPLAQRPVFPRMMLPMVFDEPAIMKLLADAVENKAKHVGFVLRRDTEAQPRGEGAQPEGDAARVELYTVGVAAEILQVGQAGPEGPLQVMLRCLERFRIVGTIAREPFIVATVEYLPEAETVMTDEMKAYALSIIKSLKELVKLDPLHKEELKLFMTHSNLNEPGRLADFSAALTTADGPQLQEILETVDIRARIEKVLVLLTRETEISRLQVRIAKQIEEKLSKHQRDFFLREQLKEIKKELGLTKDEKESEAEMFSARLKALTLTDEARERIDEELTKLRHLEPVAPEYIVTRNYLEWLTSLPWGVYTEDKADIRRAQAVLDRDHFGLEDVKERILEFLAVGIQHGSIAGSIICFVGPPGVGKTSLGQSIARSMGRNFYRFSVGGIHDEAEIKGHRRTYIGALPGKFIQVMKVCKSANPLIMLDEIDKIGQSYRGDPAAALLEVLDPEQNSQFLDHYLDVRFDLSRVFFICTANQTDSIPRPLLDRMEVIRLPGYILDEKLQIARRYLLPKQARAHGVNSRQVTLTRRALREIIDGYAREPGVRGLEQHISRIMRKAVRRFVEKSADHLRVDVAQIPELLGKRQFDEDTLYKAPRIGVVTGLAWTSMGGETIHVEARPVETGKAGFKQTGQLGHVMIESSEIAYTYVRSLLKDDKRSAKFFARNVIHLHVPAGATPKDGPSAGITMACALYSLAKQKAVRDRVAMTGELSLTGLVMPIGGIKEKAIAAKRSAIRRVIFPAGNRKDFEDLPANIRRGLYPRFVGTFEETVAACFA